MHSPQTCAREGCGKSFQPYRKEQKFCSHTCRTLAYNTREDVKARKRLTLKELGL
jgi:predicted nucleic acid-binding Zn ribbon protein